jgi:hypothetical protein
METRRFQFLIMQILFAFICVHSRLKRFTFFQLLALGCASRLNSPLSCRWLRRDQYRMIFHHAQPLH